MRKFALACALFLSRVLFAQDDLLKELEAEQAQDNTLTEFTTATFKATRIINGYSIEMPAKKNLQFIIQHRFGSINSGWRELFGIDKVDMRIGLEYGILPWLSAGFGRSSVGGTYDLSTRIKMLRQSKGGRNIPLSMAWYSNIAINSKEQPPEVDKVHRVSYAHQLMIARKFTRDFSFQVSPTYVHMNLVPTPNDKNDVFAVGMGARYLVTRSISINAEYFQPVTKREDGELYIGSLSVGIDIETGGHVFQVIITNSTGMIEQFYIPNNAAYWWDKEIHLGFNINRNIPLGGGGKKKKKSPSE